MPFPVLTEVFKTITQRASAIKKRAVPKYKCRGIMSQSVLITLLKTTDFSLRRKKQSLRKFKEQVFLTEYTANTMLLKSFTLPIL